MKTNAIIRIVLFSIIIVLLLAVLAAALGLGKYITNVNSSTGNMSSSGSVPAEAVRDVEVQWISGSIKIQTGDVDQIHFSESGIYPEDKCMVWKQEGQKLIIQFEKETVFNNIHFGTTFDYGKDLIITVPTSWVADEIAIHSVSADVEAAELICQEIELENVSGKCEFTNCATDEFSLETVSGNVTYVGKINTLSCEGVSAKCTATLSNHPREISMDGVSGDMILTLPADCGFRASMDSLSGNISTEFETSNNNGSYVFGDGSCIIDASTMSGNITIRKGQ